LGTKGPRLWYGLTNAAKQQARHTRTQAPD
jgi:hypothetical protein